METSRTILRWRVEIALEHLRNAREDQRAEARAQLEDALRMLAARVGVSPGSELN